MTHTFALSDWQTERIQRRIWLAATTNNTTLMKKLLEFGVSPNNHDNYGRTPLHISASRFIYLYTQFIYLGYVPKHHFRGKFYSKYTVNVTHTIIYRVKFSSKKHFGT